MHYSPTLVNQLVNLSDQLRNHDPQIQAGVTQPENLRWLETLRNIVLRMHVGTYVINCVVGPNFFNIQV